MAKLNTYVTVDGRRYGPEDGNLPADVVRQISNPDVWQGQMPDDAGSDVPEQTGRPVPAAATVSTATSTSTPGGIPPKGGAGSGKEVWAAYAEGKVTVTEEMSRDDIIAALSVAGVPTEPPA